MTLRDSGFSELILKSAAVAKTHSLPFFLTEFNNGLGGTNRDDASGAAFLFRNVGLIAGGDVYVWSWWTFSDVFEEQWMSSAPFHNGFGTELIYSMHALGCLR